MTCQARKGSDGQFRCALCRTVRDADDAMECPREVVWIVDAPTLVPREPFVSALAPRRV
jgi:tRNA(Ile2) C34 agmatinyltransferase TiaS